METLTQICLLGAKKETGRDDVLAEKLFRRALESTARCHGETSAELGMILMDFAAFLETKNRLLEAEILYIKVRAVLTNIAYLYNSNARTNRWFPSGIN